MLVLQTGTYDVFAHLLGSRRASKMIVVRSLYTSGSKRASLRCSLYRDHHFEKRVFVGLFFFGGGSVCIFLKQKSVIVFLKGINKLFLNFSRKIFFG